MRALYQLLEYSGGLDMAMDFFKQLFNMINKYLNVEFTFLDFSFTLWQVILASAVCSVIGYLSYELWFKGE